MSGGKRFPGRKIAVVFLLAGSGFLAGSAYVAMSRLYVIWSWPGVRAEVVSAEVQRSPGRNGHLTFQPKIRFRFSRNGNQVEADALATDPVNRFVEAHKVVATYLPGSIHDIRYNPQNPAEAKFDAGLNSSFLGISIVLLFFAAMFFVLGLSLWRSYVPPFDCLNCGHPVNYRYKYCPMCAASLKGQSASNPA